MALVDADSNFIWANVGGTGSASNEQICNNSGLKECIENGSLAFSELEPLPPKGICFNVRYSRDVSLKHA